ncbi:MAG: flavodoxin-dependent (E)-4-hydroxy-3-methylbut-2-enyl-diphosphate synthase [Dethiobacter sp.]|jgi:(E)-4-hydroxy-3-methylbut-2-enyl-diphosphate synthase|nr:flavodoxin-dependent (E)-4-hydroxy-3-methylbut-2-enyl-diphosphate synthase [Dethiobacter sp.]
MYKRQGTRPVSVGALTIGGGSDVIIQSMTTTDTADMEATVTQIRELYEAGCELVRVAVPTEQASRELPGIVKESPLPVVADIHFNHRLALAALEAGVAKLRINPGNIGGPERLAEVAMLAAAKKIPIRIGVNAGSLEKRLLEKYGHATAEALVESALDNIRLMEKLNYFDLVVSLKASSVPVTVQAYRMLAERVNYPLHIGVTEAGTIFSGTVFSAVGIGALLLDELGDTLRVSLTAHPVEEIRVAKAILSATEIRRFGPRVISCPTCGRCQLDVISLAGEIERRVSGLKEPLTLAVMGCVVNGPGEAREADLGIAGGKNQGLIFRGGEIVKKIPAENLVDEFMSFLQEYLQKGQKSRGSKCENNSSHPRI